MLNPEKIDEVVIFNKAKETEEEMLVHENIDEISILNKSGKSKEDMTVLENVDELPTLNEGNTSEKEMIALENTYEIQSVNKRFDHDLTEYENESNQSIDESIESEGDIAETMTMDDLKATLREKLKVISRLEAELDEERSASDISADQAMAKITRLTKEMATLKMEAEQEKRLVEERFEYDMLQFQIKNHHLDELAKKREKEKQDVMKELIVCHRRVQILEGKLRKQLKDGSGDDENVELDENAVSSEGDITYMPVDDDVIMGYERELGLAKYQSTLKELIDEFEEERYMVHEQLMNAQQPKGELGIDNTKEVDRFIKIGDEVDAAIKLLKDCVESLKNGEDSEVNLLRSIFQYYRHLGSDSDELRDSAESNLDNKLEKLQITGNLFFINQPNIAYIIQQFSCYIFLLLFFVFTDE